MQPLLIRADASPSMGTGHVMRCLALAQAWQDAGGRAFLLTHNLPPLLEQRLISEDVSLNRSSAESGSADDASQTIGSARAAGAEWVVVDGYRFDAAYQRSLKQAGLKVLWVDDYGHAPPYCADLVLNQNLYAEELPDYEREPSTRLLLGTSYALLRREFAPWHDWRRDVPKRVNKVLVTLGGSDAPNTTGKILEALRSTNLPHLEACVIVGPANPWRTGLEAEAAATGKNIRIVAADRDMPERMAWADVAVASAGITCWELMFMGLPTLLVVQAKNQERLAESLKDRKFALVLGWAELLRADEIAQNFVSLLKGLSQPLRAQMSQRARELVDGLGAARVLLAMGVELFRFRQAADSDCEMLWKWANDPQVRAASFSSDPIPWEEHVTWFRGKLADPGCIFYIASDSAGAPVGQVRYDVTGEEATLSVSLDPKLRGAGHGSRVIAQASRKLFQEQKVRVIHAYVKPGNEASVRDFGSAGYVPSDAATVRGHSALHFVLRKGSD